MRAMNDQRKASIALVIVVIVGVGLVGLVMMGTQVSTVLSKVGASVSGYTDRTIGEGPVDPPASTARPPTAAPAAAEAAAAGPPVLLIVRTGTLTLETTDVADAVSAASRAVVARGGFLAGSRESGAADAASATLDLRIPAARWEETLAGLRRLATVRDQQIKTDEVTGTVVDLGARITNLRATEAALQAIMAKAVRIQDILDVQSQLTTTRGEIEELSAQKASLEDRAAYGSLAVIFQLPLAAKPGPTAKPTPVWDPGKDAQQATARLVRISQKATTAGIWIVIVGLPILGVLAAGLLVLWVTWRLVSRRRAGAPTAS
jgi:Domain of unknown function (DUF4349)